MNGRIRLVLVFHNHQPIGNFGGVFESAYRDSYAPFLDVLEEYPQIPFSLHISGSLLEWLLDAHMEYIDRLRALTERGQVEIVGGAFYEPILAGIPARDRIGQIAAYSRFLETTFGTTVRGMWVPERVWEQSFASDIAEAGIEYTILDDFHFRNAGLREEELFGYYLTEDEGKLLKVFPGSERLRYTIPFRDPGETIDYLRYIAQRCPNAVAAFGDDGEKFGTWPETHKHVYQDRWLRRFLDALVANADWLKVTTLGETVDHLPPIGKCYLPDCSYREMTEWALPTSRQIELADLEHRKRNDPDWQLIKQFVQGGYWRNFRVKYPEANEMYARMLQVSERLAAAAASNASQLHPDLFRAARTELYRGQCNCSYWHGAFGGLYLPHLRKAVYRNLIQADTLLDQAFDRSGHWVEVEADDYNLDARKEIKIAGDRLTGFLAPSRGGHLYELDVKSARFNLLATLNRRPEPYHEKVREHGRNQENHGGDVASIHDRVAFKSPDLDKKLIYDSWPRKSLVDHFLEPGLALETFQHGGGEQGDFLTGVYATRLRRSEGRVEAVMSRTGSIGSARATVTKTVALEAARGSHLFIAYQLEHLPPGATIHFGVEFNFAALAAGASDRYFYDAQGRQLGPLETVLILPDTQRLGLIDEWLGVDVSLNCSRPACYWTFPIQTVSQSEGGFELVHQSSMVLPHWEFTAGPDGRFSVEIDMCVDTSAAQARLLRETAAIG